MPSCEDNLIKKKKIPETPYGVRARDEILVFEQIRILLKQHAYDPSYGERGNGGGA